MHIPEEYGGAGADAIATAIVIEEVARACASSSLIPAVNKLGTVPLLLSGSEELKQRYLPPVARGEAMFSYALSEPEAGLGRRGDEDPGRPRRRHLRPERHKRWITNAGVSRFYTVMAVTEPGGRRRAGSPRSWWRRSDEGFSFGAPEHKLGIKGSPTRELYFDNCRIPADRIIGEEGTGFRTALATLDHTRITIAAQALGIAQGALDYAAGYVKERKQFGKADRRVPGHAVHARGHGDEGRGRPAAHLRGRGPVRAGDGGRAVPDLTFISSACKCFASDVAMEVTTDAVQLLGGYGYVSDYPVERMMRDAKITQIYEGTNQIQRVVMARQLLK